MARANNEQAQRFAFDFQRRYLPALAAFGITPATARVTLTDDRLVARFGAVTVDTEVGNVSCTQQTGPYMAVKAIGMRLSNADSGLTFGTTTRGGVCLLFHEKVQGIDPCGKFRHGGLTVTVKDRDGFEAAVRRAAGLPPAGSGNGDGDLPAEPDG